VDSMKLRLILMGCILTVLGIILLIARGYSAPLIGLPLLGIVFVVVGVKFYPTNQKRRMRKSHSLTQQPKIRTQVIRS
jgi:uncharacterized membrane protein HdeD (DUF308 family)